MTDIKLTTVDISNRWASSTISVLVSGALKIGHFSVSFTDLEVPVTGLPIQVSAPTTAGTSAWGTSATAGGWT